MFFPINGKSTFVFGQTVRKVAVCEPELEIGNIKFLLICYGQ